MGNQDDVPRPGRRGILQHQQLLSSGEWHQTSQIKHDGIRMIRKGLKSLGRTGV